MLTDPAAAVAPWPWLPWLGHCVVMSRAAFYTIDGAEEEHNGENGTDTQSRDHAACQEADASDLPATCPRRAPLGPRPERQGNMNQEVPEWSKDIALEVHGLTRQRCHLDRFQEMERQWEERAKEQSHRRNQWEKARDEHVKKLAKLPESNPLRTKSEEPPEPGWVWDRESVPDPQNIRCPVVRGWFPKKLATEKKPLLLTILPLSMKDPYPDTIQSLFLKKVLCLDEKYTLLAAVHDTCLEGIEPINPRSASMDTLYGNLCWKIPRFLQGGGAESALRAFLCDVKADLGEEVAERARRERDEKAVEGGAGEAQTTSGGAPALTSKEARARALLVEHPGWTDKQIAENGTRELWSAAARFLDRMVEYASAVAAELRRCASPWIPPSRGHLQVNCQALEWQLGGVGVSTGGNALNLDALEGYGVPAVALLSCFSTTHRSRGRPAMESLAALAKETRNTVLEKGSHPTKELVDDWDRAKADLAEVVRSLRTEGGRARQEPKGAGPAQEIVKICDEMLHLGREPGSGEGFIVTPHHPSKRPKRKGKAPLDAEAVPAVGSFRSRSGPSGFYGRMGMVLDDVWEALSAEFDSRAERLADLVKALDPAYDTGTFYSPDPVSVWVAYPKARKMLSEDDQRAVRKTLLALGDTEAKADAFLSLLDTWQEEQTSNMWTKMQWPGYVTEGSGRRIFLSKPALVHAFDRRFNALKNWAAERARQARDEEAGGRQGVRDVPQASSTTPVYEFKTVGEVWHVRLGDEYGEIVDRVGMARILTLLLQPNPAEAITALKLCGVDELGIEEKRASHQEVLDGRALREYRDKLAELNSDIEEANNSGNVAKAEDLARDRESILKECRKDRMGRRKGKELGPKDAKAKAAEAVAASLKTVYKTLRKQRLMKTADHLENAIKIESYAFAYRPGPNPPRWYF